MEAERVAFFEFIRQRALEAWSETTEGCPPSRLWERGDIVPIGQFGWHNHDWTCLRRDGRLVTCPDEGVDIDFNPSAHNMAIGMLMQRVRAASAYLRPTNTVAVCPACRGSGRFNDEVCGCGGLGWLPCSPTIA
jgi:hypothetical protein